MLVARRYVDEFIPGDVVPEGRYSPEALAGMVAAGLIAETHDAPAAPPVEQTVKIKRSKRGNQ